MNFRVGSGIHKKSRSRERASAFPLLAPRVKGFRPRKKDRYCALALSTGLATELGVG